MQTRFTRGFTLFELMVTLSIAAVLAFWAVPTFRETIVQNRMRSIVTDMQASIMFARAEAVQRTTPITVAPIGGVDWADGWLVETALTGAPPILISTREASESDPLNRSVTVDTGLTKGVFKPGGNGFTRVKFSANGFSEGLGGGCLAFTSTSKDPNNNKLALVLGKSGRPRICNPNAPVGSRDYDPTCCVAGGQ